MNETTSQTTTPQQQGRLLTYYNLIVGVPLQLMGKGLQKLSNQVENKLGPKTEGAQKKISNSYYFTKFCDWMVKHAKEVVELESYQTSTFDKDCAMGLVHLNLNKKHAKFLVGMFVLSLFHKPIIKLFEINDIDIKLKDAFLQKDNPGNCIALSDIYPEAKLTKIQEKTINNLETNTPTGVFFPNNGTYISQIFNSGICHKIPCGATQCCYVFDNTLITCCRSSEDNVFCSNIILKGYPEESYIVNKDEINRVGSELSPISINDDKTCYKEIMAEIKNFTDTQKPLLSEYPVNKENFPKLHGLFEEAINTTTYKNDKKNINLSISPLVPNAYALIEEDGYKNKILLGVPFIEIFSECSELSGIIGHETGHTLQQKPEDPIPNFHHKTIEYFFKRNLEFNADIRGALAIQSPNGSVKAFIEAFLFIDIFKQRKQRITSSDEILVQGGKNLCNDIENRYTRSNLINLFHSAVDHPSTMECRIPLLIELNEKLEKLNEEFDKKI
jgi:hypothetical protein